MIYVWVECVCVCVCIYLPTTQYNWVTQGQFFKQRLTGLNLEFFFSETSCHTKVKEPILPNYLPIIDGRIDACLSQE